MDDLPHADDAGPDFFEERPYTFLGDFEEFGEGAFFDFEVAFRDDGRGRLCDVVANGDGFGLSTRKVFFDPADNAIMLFQDLQK